MKKFFIILICLVILAGCTQPATESESGTGDQPATKTKTKTKTPAAEETTSKYTDLSAEEFKKIIDENPETVVIDVSPLFDEKHIPGALSYPLGDGTFEEKVAEFDKEKTYLIYCHTDEASMRAAQMLVDMGFKFVYRLEGNFAAWEAAGYETETGSMDENVIKGYSDLSAGEFKKMIDENPDAVIVDVSPLYEDKHIPGAVNYYVGDGSLDEAIPNLDKEKIYLVYCHSDEASMLGAQKLVDAGFMKVYRLEGNFAAWEAAGYPVETGM